MVIRPYGVIVDRQVVFVFHSLAKGGRTCKSGWETLILMSAYSPYAARGKRTAPCHYRTQ